MCSKSLDVPTIFKVISSRTMQSYFCRINFQLFADKSDMERQAKRVMLIFFSLFFSLWVGRKSNMKIKSFFDKNTF